MAVVERTCSKDNETRKYRISTADSRQAISASDICYNSTICFFNLSSNWFPNEGKF
jgi:hypothetical protein